MQIVIDIPQKYYEAIMAISPEKLTGDTVLIRYGTPLPKGHGRLIDKDHVIARLEVASKFYGGENADAFDERFSHGLKEAVLKVCEEPTIIEADKAGEEE